MSSLPERSEKIHPHELEGTTGREEFHKILEISHGSAVTSTANKIKDSHEHIVCYL